MNIHDVIKRFDQPAIEVLVSNHPDCIHETYNNLWTPLHTCIERKNINAAQFLINCKANIYAKTAFGNTPVHFALNANLSLNYFLVLLKNAEREKCGQFLAESIGAGRYDVVDILLELGVKLSDVSEYFTFNNVKFESFMNKRKVSKRAILVTMGVLKRRLSVCKDMANEIGKKIWETRMDEKWTEERGAKKSKKKLR